MQYWLFFVAAVLQGVASLDNGVAKTPPMVRLHEWHARGRCSQYSTWQKHLSEQRREIPLSVAGVDVLGAFQMRNKLHKVS